MKANNGRGNIPERDEWETPQELFDSLDKQYNFGFDCCANKQNYKAPYSNDFLNEEYLEDYACWMNPPFSKATIMFKHFFSIIRYGVAIYRCDNFETKIWQDIIFPNCNWVFIPNKRIVYDGMKGSGSRFPSALIGVGVDPPKYIDGVCLKLV